jgi:hypothetical protein
MTGTAVATSVFEACTPISPSQANDLPESLSATFHSDNWMDTIEPIEKFDDLGEGRG